MPLVFIHIYLVVVQCLDFTLIDSLSQKKKKKQFLSDCLYIYIYKKLLENFVHIKDINAQFLVKTQDPSNSIWCVIKRNRASFNSKELGLDIFNHKYVVIKVFSSC